MKKRTGRSFVRYEVELVKWLLSRRPLTDEFEVYF